MFIAVRELKASLSSVLARAQQGEVIEVTSHNKPAVFWGSAGLWLGLHLQGHRLAQLNHGHGVPAAPVVAGDGVKVLSAGQVAGGIGAVEQFNQSAGRVLAVIRASFPNLPSASLRTLQLDHQPRISNTAQSTLPPLGVAQGLRWQHLSKRRLQRHQAITDQTAEDLPTHRRDRSGPGARWL